MIIHRLIRHHLKNRDDPAFYRLQAADAIQWIEGQGAALNADCEVLDLGCGAGLFGGELLKKQCRVLFADYANQLLPEYQDQPFLPLCLDTGDLGTLGRHDLVICSNVLEHLACPDRLLDHIPELLKENGHFYLSWTNWLSPWGGHEFSPFHYFGAKRGPAVYDALVGKPRYHTPYQNLFPTRIGDVLKRLWKIEGVKVKAVAPRYYPEMAFLTRLPVAREFLTWNCAVLLRRKPESVY